jgi:hypothetical protein
LAPIFVVSTKRIDLWVLEFMVSNITGNNRWTHCISLDFYFRGWSGPKQSAKIRTPRLIMISPYYFFCLIFCILYFHFYLFCLLDSCLWFLFSPANCHWSAFVYIKQLSNIGWLVCFIVLNATFNNISVISWRSVLLVEKTGESGENHRPVASHWQTFSHTVVSSTPRNQRCSNPEL